MPIYKVLFSFRGRIGRRTFWLVAAGWLVVNFVVVMGVMAIAGGHEDSFLLVSPLGWAWLWSLLALQAKRWHDRGKSGWMVLINFIPVLGPLWTLAEVGCLEGTPGPNRYGEDPHQPPDDGTEEGGYDLLRHAMRLEIHGRVMEALAAYEDITARYAHTAAGSDAQKSAENLRAKIAPIGKADGPRKATLEPHRSVDPPSAPVCVFCGGTGIDKWPATQKEFRLRPPPAYADIARLYAHTAGLWECRCTAIGSGGWTDFDEAASLLLAVLQVEMPTRPPMIDHLRRVERDHVDPFAVLKELLRLHNYEWGLNGFQEDANSLPCTCLWVRKLTA